MPLTISRLRLKNWRNFKEANLETGTRVFLVGPNASGKSNLVDAIRFLRDIVKPGGGLQYAINLQRGGLSKIRCLSARKDPEVEIEIELKDNDLGVQWSYKIGIKQEPRGKRQTFISSEVVKKNGKIILDRPNELDNADELLLTQTYIEQVNTNKHFREVSDLFLSISYLHLVPQLLRFSEAFKGSGLPDDPYGRDFLERIARTPDKTRKSRLKKIEEILKLAVPQLKQLSHTKDETGVPHLEAIYEHWRSRGARQREDQFSDGTLRLIGLLWIIRESQSPLLLEEPELSLNSGIITQIPSMIYKISPKRQVFITTHSADLLSDQSLSGKDVFLLIPSAEGTIVRQAAQEEDIRALLEAGISLSDAVLAKTKPIGISQIGLFT